MTEKTEAAEIDKISGDDNSLKPNGPEDRKVGKVPYMFMWVGDGVNMGNMTLGASVVVAGAATLNIWQTIAAAFISILIISTVFALNDRPGYKKGIPYVVQLRMSFGFKGTIISALMRAIPAVIWYGIQSWIGGTALNEILKIVTNGSFDNIVISFIILVALQIVLALYGFTSIKWVETVASIAIMAAMVYVFVIIIRDHSGELATNWVHNEGSWGLAFWGYIMVFLGNYAAIFVNAGDFSRELKTGISNGKRSLLYFSPIMVAYGAVLIVGTMVATVSGVTNPPSALAIVIDNPYITIGVQVFIVLATIATNMVANIIAPTYVLTLLTKMKYKLAVVVTGLLAMVSFPWVLVKEQDSTGMDLFIQIYSAFLGPIVVILLIDYYIFRKQQIDVNELYNKKGVFSGYDPAAIWALFIGAAFAVLQADLAWLIGFFVAGIAYILITKYAFKDSRFKTGTIYDNKK